MIKKGLLYLLVSFFVVSMVPGRAQAVIDRGRYVGNDHFVEIAKEINPSVVNIVMTRATEARKGKARRLFDNFIGKKRTNEIEDFFSYMLFWELPQRTRHEKLVGSGIVIRSDGLILTNEHVISSGGTPQVVLSDGRSYPAEIIGKDYLSDMAVIKIAEKNLPVVQFGDSDALRVGEWVLAVGNSLGLEYTVSAGIISAKGRTLFEKGTRPYFNMIQTDAPINLGNSGGPLVNMKGKVVGLNTSIIPEGHSIGFSIPINEVKKNLPDLIEKGKVTRAWLGVIFKSEPNTVNGFVIGRVIPKGPSEKAGLQTGDKILSFNGKKLKSREKLRDFVREIGVGSKITLLVKRNGGTESFEVTLEEMPIPRFVRRRIYPPGFEGFVLKLPERTRWLLVVGTALFLVLIIGVKRDLDRKSGRTRLRGKRRRGERRKTSLPFEEIRVTSERRKTQRRRKNHHKKPWFTIF